jgi:hypothetical protein
VQEIGEEVNETIAQCDAAAPLETLATNAARRKKNRTPLRWSDGHPSPLCGAAT